MVASDNNLKTLCLILAAFGVDSFFFQARLSSSVSLRVGGVPVAAHSSQFAPAGRTDGKRTLLPLKPLAVPFVPDKVLQQFVPLGVAANASVQQR